MHVASRLKIIHLHAIHVQQVLKFCNACICFRPYVNFIFSSVGIERSIKIFTLISAKIAAKFNLKRLIFQNFFWRAIIA